MQPVSTSKMKTILLSAILVVVFGCHKSTVSRVASCTTFRKSGDDVIVCPEALIYDCRCPEGVQCFWQGFAIVQCRVTKNGVSSVIRLSTLRHSAVPVSPDTTLMGYHVRLISVTGTGSP